MLKPAIHLCLVHNTPTANITPALDPDFRPREVILLHSPAQEYRADSLAGVLKPAGISVTRCLIDDTRDIEHIRDRVLELLIERESEDIALNASGGTRPMSIGAYEIFLELNKPVFFVHPETDHLSWLHRRDLPGFNVAEHIRLPAFLQAHGAELVDLGSRAGVPRNLRRLGHDLVKQAERLAAPLSALNWLAQQARQKLVSPELNREQCRWSELNDLIEHFSAENLLSFSNRRIYFENEAARFFINGGWLEQYVFGTVFGLRAELPKLQDAGHSIELARNATGKQVKNELDVAFLANNHLHIIECKTKLFGKFDHADAPGANALYKLDTLKSLLGDVHTRIMLVSYHPLSQWDRQRAWDLGVQICTARQLPELKSHIKRWAKIMNDEL
ncbi:MAG: DUF1887 family protein [Gammaproteobacteria bacterium]|nr:DUF1887 family protein [Gammaproteobacteria bacterium]